MQSETNPRPWQGLSPEEAGSALSTDLTRGLTSEEAKRRLQAAGPNRLGEDKAEPLWKEFLEEAREPIILLLFVTGAIYAIIGGLEDALVIVAVIVTLVSVEVLNEHRAGRAIRSLRRLAEPTVPLFRDGRYAQLPLEEVVPGDLVSLESGKRVPADALLVEAYSILVDESSLTGESIPVEKMAGIVLQEKTPLAERANLVYAGDTILRGRGRAVVFATGESTELGMAAKLAGEVEVPRTLLQVTMGELSKWMVLVAIAFSVVIPLLGILLVHEAVNQMILTGLSLAFATIPEELPIIITMVLALGAYRLSKERAVVRDLQAVETLGAVTVIASDKTGTLTENRVELKKVFPESNKRRILEVGILATETPEGWEQMPGDPLEKAMKDFKLDSGGPLAGQRDMRRRDLFTFDNTRKIMSVAYDSGKGLWVCAKGAPEALLARSTRELGPGGEHLLIDTDRDAILTAANRMAAEGLRVVGFAEKTIQKNRAAQDEAEYDLTFVGLAGFADAVRPEVKGAMASCLAAGIRPVMITGDHPLTAVSVAREIGLDQSGQFITGPEIDSLKEKEFDQTVKTTSVFARITPQQKLRIVDAMHRAGEVVAVTGDGVNDAPALAASDIGIAMGKGSDVAREAADIVLTDNNFTTIVSSVGEGRTLFANLTKGIRYYLACKVALVLATLIPVLLLVPVPFAPIQIILMELFMDLAASATFVAEPPEAGLMKKPPRNPKSRFLDRPMLSGIVVSAAGLVAAVLVAYLFTWYQSGDLARAQTVAFATWLLGHVFLALNMRSEKEPLSKLGPLTNRLMVIWMVATIAFTVVATSLPGVQTVFKTTTLGLGDWTLILPLVLLATFWMEARKMIIYRSSP